MATPDKHKKLPSYVYVKDETLEHYTRNTLQGKYGLLPYEEFWKERQRFLHDHGYILRPRYWPNWQPSWTGTRLQPIYCEDSIVLVEYQVMDATRSKNNETVAIKKFRKDTQESRISQYLSSVHDPHNHSVPIHEILDDPYEPGMALMVMPYLRPCNDPEFGTVGEAIEFINQTLEGLEFMHRHRIAHRDIAVENIMMDAKALYPQGHHPVRLDYSPDAIYPVSPLPRTGRKIHYYYIDFGFACHFPAGLAPLVVGDIGRDAEVPELSSTVPYDAYKVDIYALGNLYAKEFEEKYHNMDFLIPLVERMKRRQPDQRPAARDLLTQWIGIRDSLGQNVYRWRLAPKSEPAIGRMFNDTVAVALEGINHIKKYVT